MSASNASVLLISVHLHDGRYHGAPEWPPSPGRLFQALVAGAGLGGPLGKEVLEALSWLEIQPEAPLIGAPRTWPGQRVMFYMPNNDLDAVGGDPRRIAEIRTAKKYFRPLLFEQSVPFLYAWTVETSERNETHLETIRMLADRLYQFGRGVDMAWAQADVLEPMDFDEVLSRYPGLTYRPSPAGTGRTLVCPMPGSLRSIQMRYQAYRQRFHSDGGGKQSDEFLVQPPRLTFRTIGYGSQPTRYIYELRERSSDPAFARWPLTQASKLVVCVRDAAVDRLKRALPDRQVEIERYLIGRKADGSNGAPARSRVRIIPLPSIGHKHADHVIRRLLIEVPADCPIRAVDVHWAFSGLDLIDVETGEDLDVVLTPSEDDRMLGHYGIKEPVGYHVWRTVTPAALSETARRRRIDPLRVKEDAKGGGERAAENMRAASAVRSALRYAEVRSQVNAIRVQREPFSENGERVDVFASGTRFPKERLWQVEIAFDEPVAGPLVVGDGRFLGLGVMAPVERPPAVYSFVIENGLAESAEASAVARALRRAVMARVQQQIGVRTPLPMFFTGHERDGSPARGGHAHLIFAFDPAVPRLLIIAPHVVERRIPTRSELQHLRDLDAALSSFRDLRAGPAGRLALRAASIDQEGDPLFAASRQWESVTPYQVTRHAKKIGAEDALAADLRAECRRYGLPQPQITALEVRGIPGTGLGGRARLAFQVAVPGPIILGRTRHLSGGLFTGAHGERKYNSPPDEVMTSRMT